MNGVFKKLLGVFVFVLSLFVIGSVNAAEMSDEFKAILNDKKQFIAETVPPTTDFELEILVNEYLLIEKNLGDYNISNCNSSYTLCELTYWADSENSETHNIEVVYKYDKNVKNMINSYMSKLPAGKNEFAVRDLEIVNFWLNGKGSSKYITNYSSELKEYFDYKNFSLDARRGTSAPFSTGRSGMANFKYNNVVYGLIENFSVSADHVIYVPTDTEDTPQAILSAAQSRLDEYVGIGKTELTYVSTARDYVIDKLGAVPSEFATFEEAFAYEFGMENVSETDLIYTMDVYYDENSGNTHELIIRRDSTKMINPTYVSSDVSTDITISSEESAIPLDTIIQAKELTSGSEYEKIVSLLNLTDNITFDLKLYSNSIEEYINKLDDGTFEVKIPIPEDFEGKDLVVYYVDSNGKPEQYKVEITEDGYAIFKTTHFSIYTLGYRETTSSSPAIPEEKVPNTFDGIGNIVIISFISLIGLITTIVYFKNKIRTN
ncbi:MAG: hypothetical protein IKL65_02035 [Bacilli bacterium]|nr:hypothetical protein [Bacilli bacterium]